MKITRTYLTSIFKNFMSRKLHTYTNLTFQKLKMTGNRELSMADRFGFDLMGFVLSHPSLEIILKYKIERKFNNQLWTEFRKYVSTLDFSSFEDVFPSSVHNNFFELNYLNLIFTEFPNIKFIRFIRVYATRNEIWWTIVGFNPEIRSLTPSYVENQIENYFQNNKDSVYDEWWGKEK